MIHEREHSALTEQDRQDLQNQEADQVSQIKMLLRRRKQPMAFFEVMDILGFHQDSTKRALSDLTKQEEHQDKHGRPFAVYHSDIRKNNPNGKTCGTYQFNPEHGKPKHTKAGETISMFETERCAV